MGPDYPYYKYIKPPGGKGGLGMSSKGSLKTLGKNINGLIAYTEVLVSGKSPASATGQPLGNKFFLKTNGKCKDIESGQSVDRYIYIDNVPSGNIPLISSGMGVNFSEFKGLIPGTLSNMNALNPFNIMQAFMSGSSPDCQELKMETIDTYNNKSTESNFVTVVDIQNMDPCQFPNKKNPITGSKCRETFTTMDNNYYNVPNDVISKIYFASIGIIAIYILYHLMLKLHKK
jgi:hypothetical protein